MIRRPPISTRTDTLFPFTTLFRSQILPSDEGLAVQVMVSNGQGEVMSLFAVRADMDAPVNPDVVSEGGDSIAYWQEGDLAYALTGDASRSEEHTSELQSLMRISYAVFCLKKKTQQHLLKTEY